jgi:hypothetical protein
MGAIGVCHGAIQGISHREFLWLRRCTGATSLLIPTANGQQGLVSRRPAEFYRSPPYGILSLVLSADWAPGQGLQGDARRFARSAHTSYSLIAGRQALSLHLDGTIVVERQAGCCDRGRFIWGASGARSSGILLTPLLGRASGLSFFLAFLGWGWAGQAGAC